MSEMRTSVILETRAILPSDAPLAWDLPYLNLVVAGQTSLSPQGLLEVLKGIEKDLERDLQAQKWAPRIIDLDILAWGDVIFSENHLTIPHNELMNRPFFVGLMASLYPDWKYPVPGFSYSGMSLSEILHRHVVFDVTEIKCFTPFPQMVGIVNVTPDSFSDGGNYLDPEKALKKVHELADQGAAVIDIGAHSTRPGAIPISPEEEWSRLQPVLKLLSQDFSKRLARPQLSLDTCHLQVLQKAIDLYPIDYVNDVRGGEDLTLLQKIAETDIKIILNHSLTIPADKNVILSFETNLTSYLYEWAGKKVDQLHNLGISHDRILLDPGIGFGKSPWQSLSLLREIGVLKTLGLEILVGHSRKSFFKKSQTNFDRDEETCGISHYLMEKRIDYLRVHNVKAHQHSLTAFSWVKGGL